MDTPDQGPSHACIRHADSAFHFHHPRKSPGDEPAAEPHDSRDTQQAVQTYFRRNTSLSGSWKTKRRKKKHSDAYRIQPESNGGDVSPSKVRSRRSSFMLPSESRENLVTPNQLLKDEVPFVFHPFSRFRGIWDVTMLVGVLLSSVLLPLDMAFTLPPGMAEVEVMWDVLFMVDVGLNCRTGYFDSTGTYVYEPRRILWHYLRGWAIIDVPASIPFEIISFLWEGSRRASSVTKILKLLKVPRLLRFARLVRFFRVRREFASLGRISTLLLLFLYAAHFSGCFYFYLCSLEPEATSWTFQHGVHIIFNDDDELLLFSAWTMHSYTTMLYTAFLMLIGENTEPLTTAEQVFTVFVMLAGACIYATIFGQMAIILSNLNRSGLRYREKLNDVAEHLRNLNLPTEVQDRQVMGTRLSILSSADPGSVVRDARRVREYYHELWNLNRCLDRRAFFEDLSAPLKAEICLHLHGEVVMNVPFLKEVDSDCLVYLVQKLEAAIFLPGDFIVREGELGEEMYFIRRGVAEVVKASRDAKHKPTDVTTTGAEANTGETPRVQTVGNQAGLQAEEANANIPGQTFVVKRLVDHDFFGELSLVLDNYRHFNAIRATTFCDCNTLSKACFQEILHHFPHSGHRIRELVKEFAQGYGAVVTYAADENEAGFATPKPMLRVDTATELPPVVSAKQRPAWRQLRLQLCVNLSQKPMMRPNLLTLQGCSFLLVSRRCLDRLDRFQASVQREFSSLRDEISMVINANESGSADLVVELGEERGTGTEPSVG